MSGSGRLKLFFPGGKHSVYKFFAGDLHELMKKLAYEFWEQRGRPEGSPEVDWQKAQERLRSYSSASPVGPPFSAFSMGPSQ